MLARSQLRRSAPLPPKLQPSVTTSASTAAAAAPVRVFYAIWMKPWMAVNRDTYIHDVLGAAGAVNVCGDDPRRYPSYHRDQLAALAAELVVLPDEPFPFTAAERDAVAADKDAGLNSGYKKGVAVFIDIKEGLMAAAAASGQQFTFVKK